ncbi:Dipeptidyl aminopeptidase/acylaminoacyl peptidase [Tissierella praeacuta DSM 18095]|uniref:Dipeptidyl aminopeptidase/acylaminoacyl peptidase n=1 Tax=Tissierella praeacuta DSM 18095 TaxID=1123404 RepID=A0A1M4X4B1_9FIRM|nr:S9 family peptidase [Tissierella praeacuta]SHE88324.1 Dipeptidyl aminopeptidase/acylaminoacyl peptidase [Tissierella praeacuta DSM 18095]SUO99709.1 Prolyl tripeptidyl peptidase precursor [Tissierella praeacuta]
MENLKLDDFTKYKFLSCIRFSPNGKNLGFILHRMDTEENKYLSNIYIYNEEKKSEFKLTSLDEESSFIWKDNNTILFPAIRNKKDKERKDEFTTYYEININGGEANKSFEIPLKINSLEILDENNLLITAAFDPNLPNIKNLSGEEKEKAIKNMEESRDYEVLDEIPFWSNGTGFTNKKRNRLYIYNLRDKILTPITDEFTEVESFKLNKDKSKILIVASSYMDKMQLKSDLHLYNIKEDKLEKLTHEDVFSYFSADFLENKIIFTGHNMKSYGVNENPNFYLMNLDGTNAHKISKDDFDYSIWNSVGSDCRYGSSKSIIVDGEHLYFITTELNNSYINRINKNGDIEKLTTNNGSIDGFDVLNGNIKFIGLRGLRLQELYSLEEKKEVQLTKFNEWVINEKKLSTPEHLSFEVDGVTIDGWIMKPVDFDKNKKYPGILDIHGGPKTVYGEVFYHEMQYWANEGYTVFFCNPRGSDGKGNEFADIRGKYGTIDYDDLMKFTDLILEKYPFIDRERIGVTGGSYGGFMTNWIIGHTKRFRAAASQRSISNWISKFGTTDIGYYFVDDQQAATPWSDVEKLWFHSPMKYADKVVTPTLFIHSEEDYRCWLPEGIQMFTSLKYHGVDSRLIMFRGENHELSRSGKPNHRIKRLEEITNWFNKYLKK